MVANHKVLMRGISITPCFVLGEIREHAHLSHSGLPDTRGSSWEENPSSYTERPRTDPEIFSDSLVIIQWSTPTPGNNIPSVSLVDLLFFRYVGIFIASLDICQTVLLLFLSHPCRLFASIASFFHTSLFMPRFFHSRSGFLFLHTDQMFSTCIALYNSIPSSR